MNYILIVNFGRKNWAFDKKTLLSKMGFFRNIVQTKKIIEHFQQFLNKEYMINQNKKYAYIEI